MGTTTPIALPDVFVVSMSPETKDVDPNPSEHDAFAFEAQWSCGAAAELQPREGHCPRKNRAWM